MAMPITSAATPTPRCRPIVESGNPIARAAGAKPKMSNPETQLGMV